MKRNHVDEAKYTEEKVTLQKLLFGIKNMDY